MSRRTELRFEVYAGAQVILLDDPGRDFSASLAGISAAGFQLVATEELPSDQMIAVEVEEHLLLAEVRYSHRRGSRYSIGAKRIHTLAKLDLPEDATRIEKVQALIDDFHLHLRTGIALAQEKVEQAEEISEATAEEPVPESPVELQEEPVETAAPEPSEADPEIPARILDDSFEPEPSFTFHAIPRANQPVLPHLAIPARSQFSSAAMLKTESFQTQEPALFGSATRLEPKPEPTGVDRARGLGEKEKHAIKTAAILTGIIAGLSVLAVEALWFGPFRVSADILPARTLAASITLPHAPSADPTPQKPAEAEPAKPRLATITATADSWISACSDGRVVFENLLAANTTQQIRFSRTAVIRLGNAGGVGISVDGKSIGPVGTPGMVRVVELLEGQNRLLPPNQPERPGDCQAP